MSPLLPKFSLAPLSLSCFAFCFQLDSCSVSFSFFREHSSGSHDSRSFCCLRSEPVSLFCEFKLSVLICMRKKGRFFVPTELERADGTAFCLLPSVLPFSLLVVFSLLGLCRESRSVVSSLLLLGALRKGAMLLVCPLCGCTFGIPMRGRLLLRHKPRRNKPQSRKRKRAQLR